MPQKPKKPCSYYNCPEYATVLDRCEKHVRPPWEGRRGFIGYTGQAYSKLRRQVLKEEPYCAFCGDPAKTVDHIIPRSKGGSNDRSNLRGLCKPCHNIRSREQSIRKKSGS